MGHVYCRLMVCTVIARLNGSHVYIHTVQVSRGLEKDKVLVEYVTQGIPLVVTSFFRAGTLALTLFKVPVRRSMMLCICG